MQKTKLNPQCMTLVHLRAPKPSFNGACTHIRGGAPSLCGNYIMMAVFNLSSRVAVTPRRAGLRNATAIQSLIGARRACSGVKRSSPRRARQMQAQAAADVFALDFDGVLVDSEPEISSSACAAAAEYWPEQFGRLDQSTMNGVRQKMRVIRPVLIHGVESLVMVHLCTQTGSLCLQAFMVKAICHRHYNAMVPALPCRPGWYLKSLTVLAAYCKTGRQCWQKPWKSGM